MIVIYAGAAGTQTFYVLFMVGEDVYSNMVLLTVR